MLRQQPNHFINLLVEAALRIVAQGIVSDNHMPKRLPENFRKRSRIIHQKIGDNAARESGLATCRKADD